MKKIDKWIIATESHSGLGFAMLIQKQSGHEVIEITNPEKEEKHMRQFNKTGDGILETMPLGDFMKSRKDYKDWGFIWDGNHSSDEAEILRKEGFNILGGHKFSFWLENNREFGLNIVHKAGIESPPSQEFNDIKSGLEFLQANEDKAYVFKPDEKDQESWTTTTPDNENDREANKEMIRFLGSQKDGKGTYLFQERKKGVEVNIETWLYKGKPFFAFADFECKRKDNKDLGRMVGCSQDIAFTIPLDCKIMKDSLLKLVKQTEFKDYTGFIDMNLIVGDNHYWFLEFCGRFGYNMHPNLFMNLAISPMAEIVSDMMQGNIDDFYRHFRKGFGATVTAWIDKLVVGLPLSFQGEDSINHFYHYDSMFDGEDYFLAGYSNEVGLVCAHDYDIKSAADEALRIFNRIHYPGRTGRTDLNRTDYDLNPQERYIAAEAMRLFQS